MNLLFLPLLAKEVLSCDWGPTVVVIAELFMQVFLEGGSLPEVGLTRKFGSTMLLGHDLPTLCLTIAGLGPH